MGSTLSAAAAKSEADDDNDGKDPIPNMDVEGITFSGGGAERTVVALVGPNKGVVKRLVAPMGIGSHSGRERRDGSLW